MEVAEARKWPSAGRAVAQATVCTTVCSVRCARVVEPLHAAKQRLSCPEVAGTLTTAPNMSQWVITLTYVCVVLIWCQDLKLLLTDERKKKRLLSFSLQWWAFNFCVVITLLPINLFNCTHHLQSPCISLTDIL